MKRIRAWLYFLLFFFTLAGLSRFRDADPELYEPLALVFSGIWALILIVLSVLTLRAWMKPHYSKASGGLGLPGLPLPRTWKRWIYDE